MGSKKITPRDPTIGAAALTMLRAATVGHDHVDLGTRRLPANVFAEVRSVLRQLGAEWHGGRKLFTFTAGWSAEKFSATLASGRRPT
jgi:hypothetical protein